MNITHNDVRPIAEGFLISGSFVEATPYGSGHINETVAVVFEQGGKRLRYILQRINHHVFKNPPAVMENILRVTEAATESLKESGHADVARRTLTVIPAKNGQPFVIDGEGYHWRCYTFIEGASTYDIVSSPEQAYEAARAFGNFQSQVANLQGGRLHETILNFHHTRSRFDRFMQVVAEDPKGRLKDVRAEVDYIRSLESCVDVLLNLAASDEIPERITHNDTKLNNVMIDDATGEAICVIDLDTVMPGLALYDFGDMMRTATSPAAEDELDLSKVTMQMSMFQALARGYLSSAGGFLTPAEKAYLPFSGKLITLEIGIRFLTDHLEGDVYFKIHRPDHNLDRARTQLALVRSIAEQEDEMRKYVDSLEKQPATVS